MAKFIQTENNYRIYELEHKECQMFHREEPTFITWKYDEDIGNMLLSENESGTLEEMIKWCKEN